MKLFIVALLVAISYAQTGCDNDPIEGYTNLSEYDAKWFTGGINAPDAVDAASCAELCTESELCLFFQLYSIWGTLYCQFLPFDVAKSTSITLPGLKMYTKCTATEEAAVQEAAVQASAHGDPIIWTFKNECYDLNKDGLYLASSHPDFMHDVYIAVYNEFIREIQIRDPKDGDVLLSISNLNEVTGTWDYGFKQRVRQCNNPTWKECEWTFNHYDFDAQVFKYSVQILFHDYLDPALKDGERGMHLDIYPRVYAKKQSEFVPAEFKGAYFDNPHPNELAFCPAGSMRR